MKEDDDRCAACGTDLLYTYEEKVYTRKEGHIEPGVYDGVLYWSCPSCGHRWHRWPPGSPLRERAKPYLPEAA